MNTELKIYQTEHNGLTVKYYLHIFIYEGTISIKTIKQLYELGLNNLLEANTRSKVNCIIFSNIKLPQEIADSLYDIKKR